MATGRGAEAGDGFGTGLDTPGGVTTIAAPLLERGPSSGPGVGHHLRQIPHDDQFGGIYIGTGFGVAQLSPDLLLVPEGRVGDDATCCSEFLPVASRSFPLRRCLK